CAAAIGKRARKILRDASPGDVAETFDQPCLEQWAYDAQIRPMRRKQRIGHGGLKLGNEGVRGQPCYIEQHAPGERVPVGVQSRRRKSDQRVAWDNLVSIDHSRLLDD